MSAEFPIATAQLLTFREEAAKGDSGGVPLAEITLPNGTVYGKEGKIDFVDAAVSQDTDTVTVRARFENPDAVLLDGALVEVALEQSDPALVLNIPQRAVQRDQAGAFVMVVGPESKVEMKRVEVSRTTRERSVIETGLEEGDMVITDGVNKVRPGIAVDAATAADG